MSRNLARSNILDSAEAQFAQRGYHGVSMRQVADGASLSLSLVQYHFGTKDALFSAVMERRIVAINHDRLRRLDQAEQNALARGHWSLDEVLRSFLEPTVLLARDRASGGFYYAQLISQVTNDPQPHARAVSRNFTNPIARQTMRALHLALPDLDTHTLTWCYVFSVGAMIAAISPTGRVRVLSNNECDPDNVVDVMSLLVPFLSGAFERIARMRREGQLTRPTDISRFLPLPQVDDPTAAAPVRRARTAAKPAPRKSPPQTP